MPVALIPVKLAGWVPQQWWATTFLDYPFTHDWVLSSKQTSKAYSVYIGRGFDVDSRERIDKGQTIFNRENKQNNFLFNIDI